jgi:hypothetical protein
MNRYCHSDIFTQLDTKVEWRILVPLNPEAFISNPIDVPFAPVERGMPVKYRPNVKTS